VFLNGLSGQCFWLRFYVTGKYGDLLDFVVIIVLILYTYDFRDIYSSKKMNAERPYRAFGYPFLPAFYIVVATAICICHCIHKTSTSGWGVVIMLLGIPVYYLVKKKE
jgi:APA family basic amino acid/polyamine antiporter